MLFYLAFKNIVSRKSSAVIVLFISFSIMLMVVVNSIFDCTENGIEKVFSRSFTGDFAIFPKSDYSMSLFGDETPVTGNLTQIDTLVSYNDLRSFLESNPKVESLVPQVTCFSAMEFGGSGKIPVYLFGVDGVSYVKSMSAIKILRGEPFPFPERGCMISAHYAELTGADLGDTIQFTVVDGPTFRIRAAKVYAVYDYEIQSDTLDKIVLVDSVTAKQLLDMSESVAEDYFIDEEKTSLLDEDMDSIFDDAEDVDPVFFDEEIPSENSAEKNELNESFASSSSWNFLMCNLSRGTNAKKIIRALNKNFKKRDLPLRAVDWRTAAGSTALYLYWMRIIFNAGVIVILACGFIIINNTLVVNVLNRTQEIGTLRAEGASRIFVSLQCMIETFLLTITAGILGCILGAFCDFLITNAHIVFKNSFIRQLFGAETLSVHASFYALLKAMILSVLLGFLGWIYPVRTALSVNPVQAMQGGV